MGSIVDLEEKVRHGRLSRRDFLGCAAALGVGAGLASTRFAAAAETAMPKKGGVLKAGLSGGQSTDTLDPALDQNKVPFTFARNWGEFLVTQKPDGSLKNLIAEEFDSSPDATRWTMKIRKGVEFHNGKTVTPQDVAATLERHSDKNSKSGAYGILKDIDTIKVDGDTVVLTLKTPNAELPYLMTDYHILIQPNGGKDDPNAGISAGPYRIVSHQPGVHYVGERFENYWAGDELGHADRIEVLVVNDDTARMTALQSGKVDMINAVAPRIVSFIERIKGVKLQNVSGKGFYPFNMFCDTAPFDNNDLRMALKLATDRKQMLDTVLRGYGDIGNDFPINGAYALFPDDIPQREFDPDQAKHYYKKSGYDGSIVLRASDVAFPGALDAAQLFQQSCAQAGIKIDVHREPSDGYWSSVWNSKPFCESYWGGRPTQDLMYTTAMYSGADWNDTNFHNEKFDKMLLEARGELDESKRKAIYHDMALLVRDKGGEIVPFFNQLLDATGSKVAGYTPSPIGELMNGYALAACWVAT
ncbi:ABC transporter substrate-binding protein [Pararhizobium mangrovi]|uniref:ABC transporter substrate-binding protein n=1 Tax=Pararhizobium mangrovi TaxID=2590452 RepID=A0A506U024_9HYPH|nr:ABC transporter substrate-binding protein [Pararhizobium mangrovi]TPW25929.1 ABC transporter substrate-binding protein [Pararhizobium mangrovi]